MKSRLCAETYQVFVLWEHYFPNMPNLPLLSPAQGTWKWPLENCGNPLLSISQSYSSSKEKKEEELWDWFLKCSPNNIPFLCFVLTSQYIGRVHNSTHYSHTHKHMQAHTQTAAQRHVWNYIQIKINVCECLPDNVLADWECC